MDRSLTTSFLGKSPNSCRMRGSMAASSPGSICWAVRISSVVSRESISTPKTFIHWLGSATPQVWPMPRPPNVPIVAMFSQLRMWAARQKLAMLPTSAESSAAP